MATLRWALAAASPAVQALCFLYGQEIAGDLVGSVDRTVDLSQERFHTEYFDPLELRVQCATVLSTFVLLPVFFYAAVAMNPEVPIGAMRKRAAVSMAAGTLTVHACFVLFGAPAITAFFKTFALSVCIGAVVVVPLGCSLGGDVKAWQRVISHNDPRRPAESQFYVPAALTAFGAWLGAFPIPLDWDRPWQAWPITCTAGAAAGHFIGLLAVAVSQSLPAAGAPADEDQGSRREQGAGEKRQVTSNVTSKSKKAN